MKTLLELNLLIAVGFRALDFSQARPRALSGPAVHSPSASRGSRRARGRAALSSRDFHAFRRGGA